MRQKERGVHWSALYINKDKVFFFDSYALVPAQEIVDFLSQHSQRMRNTLEVQSFGESNCGQNKLLVRVVQIKQRRAISRYNYFSL